MQSKVIVRFVAGLTLIAALALVIIVARWATSPALPWYQITGMAFPATASVVKSGVSNSGARWMALKIDGPAVQQLLGQPPPWGHRAWIPGPVDLAIVEHLQFNSELWGFMRSQETNQVKFLGGSDDIWKVLSSKATFYVADPYKTKANPTDPWAKGRILILDPVNGQLWANAWDRSGF